MWKTVIERDKFIQKEGLHMNENGDILDDEGNLYNPWCFAYKDGNRWQNMVGVEVTHEGALKRLYQLKLNGPHVQFKMYRGNDLDSLTVYTS